MKTIMRVMVVLCVLLPAAAPMGWEAGAMPAAPAAGTTERVSVASDESQGNDHSEWPSLSANGRYVAFESQASNLAEGDTNGFRDVFVRDRVAGSTERVSVASDESQGNNDSYWPSISANGRYVAFYSEASNLVEGDTNNQEDVFVRDHLLGITERVSVASDEGQGNNFSGYPSISADGRYVAFSSEAYNLVDGDTNNSWDIFVRDREAGTTERVSVAGDDAQGNYGSLIASISGDGRCVAFTSWASNLVGGDTNGFWDIFVRDRVAGTTERASVASDGTQGNEESEVPSISSDGRYVAFWSDASNLVGGDTNGFRDVIVRDLAAGATELASVASDGGQGNGDSWWYPSISADGRYVAFRSAASNLVDEDTNGYLDVFVRDRVAGTTERVSVASDGSQANGVSMYSSFSADGRSVAFASTASNLVSEDTNGYADVFVRYRGQELIDCTGIECMYLPVVFR